MPCPFCTPPFPPDAKGHALPIQSLSAETLLPLQKEKEEIDDVTTELELADEDETVPYDTSPHKSDE